MTAEGPRAGDTPDPTPHPSSSDNPVNVDADELTRFAAMAERWWDPDGDARPLHAFNPVRMAYLARRASLRGARILDIGCGGGLLAEALTKAGATVTALDATEAALKVARAHAAAGGLDIRYEQATVEDWAACNPTVRFDYITCLELLEHVPSPSRIVATAACMLAPGGKLFISTINRTPRAWLLAILGAEYLLRLVPRGTHSFDKLVKPSEIAAWARGAGLTMTDIIGFRYLPFSETFEPCKDVSVNYLVELEAPAPPHRVIRA